MGVYIRFLRKCGKYQTFTGPESFVRGVQTLITFFFSLSLSLLIDGEGGSKYDYERAIIGTPAKRHECCPLVALWFLGDRDQYC